jgi:predicted Rossmann-fold nucleotide-binding protein
MLDWVRERPLAEEMVSPEDLELVAVTDDPAEAVRTIVECYDRRCAAMPAEPEKADAQ